MYSSGKQLKNEGSRSQVVIAGAIAGMTTRFVIAPLDVIKIRLQLQSKPLSNVARSDLSLNGSPMSKSAIQTFQHLVRSEGFSALWKGNIPAEFMYISYSAIQFTTYKTSSIALQKIFGENRLARAAETYVSGAFAGALATAATYPLDLLRTRLAAQGTKKVYYSLAHAVQQIYMWEGLNGFFRGLRAGLSQIVPYMGTFFTVYEILRLPLRNLNLPLGTGEASAGVLASVLAKSFVFPFDLIRKRLQVQGPTRLKYAHGELPIYNGITRTMSKIVRTEGIRGLYRGLSVSLIKAGPTGAITMWTYERTLHILMKLDEVDEKI